MKDWEVFDDVYVAAFSFARYQMWQDLRRNMDEFSKNELISSLLHNRCEIKDTKDVEFREDDCPPTQTLMPSRRRASSFRRGTSRATVASDVQKTSFRFRPRFCLSSPAFLFLPSYLASFSLLPFYHSIFRIKKTFFIPERALRFYKDLRKNVLYSALIAVSYFSPSTPAMILISRHP